MRIMFSIVLGLHVLIHFLGPLKSFHPQLVPQLSRNISRTEGIFWFLDGILLLLALLFLIYKKELWPFLAIAGVLLSQILISLNWSDAKYGTFLNLLILAVSVPAIARGSFQKMVSSEVAVLRNEANITPVSKMQKIEELPEVVQKWLKSSGAAEYANIRTVYLEQQGKMRTTPEGRWMDFTAVQNFSVQKPGFVWYAEVSAYPGISLSGRDKLRNSHGEMLIKAASIIPVVDEKGNEKIDSGSLLRYLGEICWFPSAARANFIEWTAAGQNSAVAEITSRGLKVKGTFYFSPDGTLLSFETLRFYGAAKNSRPEKWHIEILENQNFDGILVPSKCRVTWKLAEGDFTWLELEVNSLKYNP
ncbi:MAG: DUF6544 family protein [Salinimicrobium sp.]